MKINRSHWLMGLSTAVLLTATTACVDNDYDLSDIDTTTRINAKDLVVPINLDKITLDQVLDLDDDSEVKEIVQDGKKIYAVQKDGDFSSDPIKVSAFTASKPYINPIVSTLDLVLASDVPSDVPEGAVPEVQVTGYYDIKCDPTSFESKAENVDKAIKSIGYIGVRTSIVNQICVTGFSASQLQNIKIEGLVVLYPKGLDAAPDRGKYDKATGALTFTEALVPNANGIITLKMDVNGIDPKVANIAFDADNHVFTFGDDISVKEGRVNLYLSNKNLPEQITFKVTPSIDPIQVETFTGKIDYDVEEFNINPIDISNLPDFLNQKGTKVSIANPQLYLKMNNPLEGYIKGNAPMRISSGLTLTSKKDGKTIVSSLDGGRFLTDAANTNNTFVFSPSAPARSIAGYQTPQHVKFTKLSNVLDVKGEGIPTTISVDVDDPRIPETDVVNLKLGSKLPKVVGNYTFYAPLQLNDQSLIVYTDTLDGWSDEELDKMTLTGVNFSFSCSNDVPFDMELSVVAIDKNGRVIPGAESNVAKVPAKASNSDVNLTINATISKIDGVMIKARLLNKGSDTVLAPTMTFDVKNVRAKVSGYYQDEF